MILAFRPIERWPGELTRNRQTSQFSASYRDTLLLLDRELSALRASSPVLQLAIDEADLRLDGQVKANAKPRHPGVILSFETKDGPLSFPCDRFDVWHTKQGEGWHHNLRAVALGLEALRKVDRYGITKRGEQYTGWKALGAGIEMPPVQMTVDEAVAFLHSCYPEGASVDDLLTELDMQDRVWLKDAYRMGAKKLHPDAGGDPEQFKRLTEAWRVIEQYGQNRSE